jgi:hypothetical protein
VNAGAKLGAYGLLLAGVLGGGAAVGAAAGPIDVGGGESADHAGMDMGPGTGDMVMGETETAAAELPAGGLLVSQDGYTLVPEDRLADAGEFAFSILGPDGVPLEAYDELHDRELHLIVAKRDLQEFVHVHPERDGDGRWSVDLPALPSGSYRAFADFQPAGAEQYTLGVDVVSPGGIDEPQPLEPTTADRVDGLDVTVDGDVAAGTASEVTVTVARDGQVITTEPYLGAAGHLVALRDGDLAYLHVHPLDEEPGGPVRFAVEVPSPGTYALFFDFLLDGEVRTARFVLEAHATASDDAADGGH